MEHRVIEEFNKEAFIEAVEKRPTIWNIGSPEYANRILKKKAWRELVDIFIHPEASNKKRILFGEILQKKWKSLKDTYVKEYKKIKHGASTSSGPQTSNYIYFSKLSFLQKCVDEKEAKANAEKQTSDPTESVFKFPMPQEISPISDFNIGNIEPSGPISLDTDDSDNCPIPEFDRVLRTSDFPSFAIMGGKSSTDREVMEDEDDKMFCMSLYKELIKVPEKIRLITKIRLLDVLRLAQMEEEPISQSRFYDPARPRRLVGIWQKMAQLPPIQTSYTTGQSFPMTTHSSASSMDSSISSNCSVDFDTTMEDLQF